MQDLGADCLHKVPLFDFVFSIAVHSQPWENFVLFQPFIAIEMK